MTLYFVIDPQDCLSSVVRGWLSSKLCGVCNDIIFCDLPTGSWEMDCLSNVVRGWLSSMLCGVCNDIIFCDLPTGQFIQCCEKMAQFYVVWVL